MFLDLMPFCRLNFYQWWMYRPASLCIGPALDADMAKICKAYHERLGFYWVELVLLAAILVSVPRGKEPDLAAVDLEGQQQAVTGCVEHSNP